MHIKLVHFMLVHFMLALTKVGRSEIWCVGRSNRAIAKTRARMKNNTIHYNIITGYLFFTAFNQSFFFNTLLLNMYSIGQYAALHFIYSLLPCLLLAMALRSPLWERLI